MRTEPDPSGALPFRVFCEGRGCSVITAEPQGENLAPSCAFRRGYRAQCRGGNKEPYKLEEIDFLAAYLCFYPSGCSQGGYFECYREAWHLMAAKARKLQASS